jgi:tRNA(Ser,Leu) C12 N-acetylase TAN1
MIAGRILDSGDGDQKKKNRYKVSLDNPDATIVVEIVRTLCGISVVPRTKEMANNKFSLVTAREKASPPDEV